MNKNLRLVINNIKDKLVLMYLRMRLKMRFIEFVKILSQKIKI